MDFHEAKDITLWKLAITHGSDDLELHWKYRLMIWRRLGDCVFCEAAGEKQNLSDRKMSKCSYCPIFYLCDDWEGEPNDRALSLEGLRYYYNELSAMSMPDLP